MIQWPVALQQFINQAGFNQTFGSTKLTTEMETGPKKVRRRFTNRIDTFSCVIDLDREDYDTFESFYDVTLNGGVEYFEYNHPISGNLEEFRFLGDPVINVLGGTKFRIAMNWEIKP